MRHKEQGLKALIGHGAGYVQIARLRASFGVRVVHMKGHHDIIVGAGSAGGVLATRRLSLFSFRLRLLQKSELGMAAPLRLAAGKVFLLWAGSLWRRG